MATCTVCGSTLPDSAEPQTCLVDGSVVAPQAAKDPALVLRDADGYLASPDDVELEPEPKMAVVSVKATPKKRGK